MYYKKKNITFYYDQYGSKPDTIIILPGWGNTSKTFTRIIDYFKNNYSIIIFDYPGFGKSPLPNKILTIYDYAEVIASFIKEKNIINPIIIAHSFGGRITAILNKYNLNIKKIILIDVAGIKRKKSIIIYIKEKVYKILKFLTKYLPTKIRNYLRKKIFDIFSSSDYQQLSPLMQKTFQNIIHEDLTNYYKKTKTETLILWGEKDQDTPLKDGYLLERIIPNSALIVFKDGSHYSYLDYEYETILILKSFIK